MKFLLPVILALSSVTFARTPPVKDWDCSNATIDILLFEYTMSEFQAARKAQKPACLDWSSDGCSSSPNEPFGFNFLPSCTRHDFGYRNYKARNRFTKWNKAKIDGNFKLDLYDGCDLLPYGKSLCQRIANLYYQAVKQFGSKTIDAVMAVQGDWDED